MALHSPAATLTLPLCDDDSRDLPRLPGHPARRRRRPRPRHPRARRPRRRRGDRPRRLVEHQLQGRAGDDPQGPGRAHLAARARRRPRRRGRRIRRRRRWPSASEVLVTGYDLGVAHHGGWAQYARVPAGLGRRAARRPRRSRQAMALGTAGLTAGLSIHALEAHGLRPDRRAGARARRQRRRRQHRGRRAGRRRLRGLGRDGQGRPGRLPARPRRARDRHARGDDRRLRPPAGEDALGGGGRPGRRRRHRLRPAHDALRRRRRAQRPDGRHDAGHDGAALHPARRRACWASTPWRRAPSCGARCGRAWPATCARAASTTRSRARSTWTGIEPVLDALLAGEAVGRTVVRLPAS